LMVSCPLLFALGFLSGLCGDLSAPGSEASNCFSVF
jgi:hypothetical protein